MEINLKDMKTIIIGLSILLLSLNTKANQVFRDTIYHQNPGLHKFNGEWEYSDSSITFQIFLKSEKISLLGSNDYMELITGYHVFIKNGKVVQSSVGKKISIRNGFYVDESKSLNKIRFLFTDLGSGGSLRGTLELMPDNTLIWQVSNLEGVRLIIKMVTPIDYNIYVPQHLILKKVK
jgi:hypothetical protein